MLYLVSLSDPWALQYYRGRYGRTANGGKGINFPTMASAKDFAEYTAAKILSSTGRIVKFEIWKKLKLDCTCSTALMLVE